MRERTNKERAIEILKKLNDNDYYLLKPKKDKPFEIDSENRFDELHQALDIAIESLKYDDEQVKFLKNSLDYVDNKKDNEWVDVRDRLPINYFLNLSKDVLICNAEGEMFVAYYDYKKQCWRNKSKVFTLSDNVIAWKPLPKPYVRSEEND